MQNGTRCDIIEKDSQLETLARTYRLRAETVQRIDAVTRELELNQSSLVDELLALALDDLVAGRLILRRRVVRWEIDTLERKYT